MGKEAGVGEGQAPTPEGPWAGETTLASGDLLGQHQSPTNQLQVFHVATFHHNDQMLLHHLPDTQETHGGQKERRWCQGTSRSRSLHACRGSCSLEGRGWGQGRDSSPEGRVSIRALPTGRGKSSAQRWEMEGRAPPPLPCVL